MTDHPSADKSAAEQPTAAEQHYAEAEKCLALFYAGESMKLANGVTISGPTLLALAETRSHLAAIALVLEDVGAAP